MQTIKCESGLTVDIQIVSVQQLRVTPVSESAERWKVDEHGDNRIVKLDFEGFVLSEGQEIELGNNKYKIQKIVKLDNNSDYIPGYELLTIGRLSKSSMFLLPLLGGNRNTMRWNQNFMNCFIGTEDWGVTESLFLWYRFDSSKEGIEFEERIMNHPNFMYLHDVDQYHVMYEFSVPERYKDDYFLIMEGKYSKIKESTKKALLNFHNLKIDRPLGQILYKDPIKRKQLEASLGVKISEDLELHDPFYEKDELFMNKYRLSDSNALKRANSDLNT